MLSRGRFRNRRRHLAAASDRIDPPLLRCADHGAAVFRSEIRAARGLGRRFCQDLQIEWKAAVERPAFAIYRPSETVGRGIQGNFRRRLPEGGSMKVTKTGRIIVAGALVLAGCAAPGGTTVPQMTQVNYYPQCYQ